MRRNCSGNKPKSRLKRTNKPSAQDDLPSAQDRKPSAQDNQPSARQKASLNLG